jgi:hypothetical protein
MSDVSDLSVLLQIEARALEAQTLAALRFTIVNETHALTPYRQAALFELDGDRVRLAAASGLVSVANDSPFAVWLSQFAQRLPRDGAVHCLDHADAAGEDAKSWAEWLPEHLLWAPLPDKSGVSQGMVLYAREQAWDDPAIQLVQRLHATYGYCFSALHRSTQRSWSSAGKLFKNRRNRWLLVSALVLGLFIPVRMSVLAPAEVIALNAMAVAAPQDGVVGSFAVAPNARVKAWTTRRNVSRCVRNAMVWPFFRTPTTGSGDRSRPANVSCSWPSRKTAAS